ncbi:M10 family metallopeptidase C-terminal domain-containing protein [Caulobacter segnis]
MSVPSQDDIITSMVTPNAEWPGDVITFSIPGADATWPGYTSGGVFTPYSEPSRPGYSTLTADQASAFRKYIQIWADYIPVSFVETDDKTKPGDIRIAFSDTGSNSGGHTYSYLGDPGLKPGGDIWMSAYYADHKYVFDMDTPIGDGSRPVDNAALLLREIGHALGLSDASRSGTLIPAEYQNYTYSIMANDFTNIARNLPFFQFVGANKDKFTSSATVTSVTTPMVFDILALQSIYGVNTSYKSGNDTYKVPELTTLPGSGAIDGLFIKSLFDGGGIDTIDLSDHEWRSVIDLTPGAYSSIDIFTANEQIAYWVARFPDQETYIRDNIQKLIDLHQLYTGENNLGIAYSTIIENVIAGSGNDIVIGNDAANRIEGGAGNDALYGRNGDDILIGGAGDDFLEGGDGIDTAEFSGAMSSYSVVKNLDGSITVTDLRAGSPDGVDKITGVEKLLFAPEASPEELAARVHNILRTPSASATDSAFAKDLLTRWTAGQLSAGQVTRALVDAADATTSVASLNYQFFTGKVPTEGGVDFLTSPTGPNTNNLNSAYYAKFDVVNRYINFAVNLGKNGEAKDSFAASYGSLSLLDATKKAYAAIFGGTPTDTKVHQLIDSRVDYLAYYGGDGANGIGTKAAMVGFLLAAAATENLGVMAKSNEAWLTDLADGSAPFAVNLLDPTNGYFKTDFIFGG